MTSPTNKTVIFPKIRRVVIHSLTVYSQRSTIELAFPDGVFCLAGANGLGKSTFIAAINFGLTGRVPEPTRGFSSVNEYYQQTEPFSRNYFTGRVSELDRDKAHIELQFTVGDYAYHITRGLFETGELRSLHIRNGDGSPIAGGADSASLDTLHDIYGEMLAQHIGLSTFQQFVFLQHFLLTFDERRSLTFWDPQVLQETLFLAFGYDPALAAEADQARRQAERLGSIVRNLTYQATETRKKLRDVESVLAHKESQREDIVDQHRSLTDKRDDLAMQIESVVGELSDKRLHIEQLNVTLASLHRQYEEAFAERSVRHFGLSTHPLIVRSLADRQCNLCGQDSHVEELRRRSQGRLCPLCGVQLLDRATDETNDLEQLEEIDAQIEDTRSELDSANQGLLRIEAEHLLLQGQVQQLNQQLSKLEMENRNLFVRVESDSDVQLAEIANQYRKQVADLYESRRKHSDERDSFRSEFKKIQEELMRSYASSEGIFIPRFRTLARAFLGLDLDAALGVRGNAVNLTLEVEGTVRRQIHQLSESQRFFVDIALRMAIGEFMADGSGPVTMYIDTPEGSLDIAYESRAGEMFAQFIENGSHIIMTANINTSQLLSRLASRCGPSRMWLERMTDWTHLSDVQRKEEKLFEAAYQSIESALQSSLIINSS